jgi:branched-chain amino acid transport system substrate-binding protein
VNRAYPTSPPVRTGSRATRRASLLSLIGLAILGGSQTGRAAEPEPVVLGAIYNLTGAQADLDIPSSRGARLAIDGVNRKGGVLGRPVRLVLEDGQSKADVVARKTADLLKKHPSASALFGLSDTDLVLAAAPVAARHKRLFLTSGATSPRLPGQVPTYLFLACFGDNVQAAAGAEWAYKELKARTVSVLFDSSKSYTRLLHGYFQTRWKQLGGKVVSVKSYTPKDLGPKSVRGLEQADLIYLAAEPGEVLKAVGLLRAAGLKAPILGGDGLDLRDEWRKAPNVEDVYFTTHAYLGADNPDPRVKAFREAYVRAYPGSTPDAFAALGYDAARLLTDAVARAKSPDPARVLKAMAETRRFQGVTGTMTFAPGSRIPTKSVTILRIEHGRRKFVRVLRPDRVPPPGGPKPGEVPKALRGTWVAKKVVRDGKPTSDVVGHRLTFTADRFVIRSPKGKVVYQGTVRVDPGQKPAAIDFKHTGEGLKGKVWKGIYSIDGDTLRICDNAPDLDKGRPKTFTARAGSGHVFIVFDRARP